MRKTFIALASLALAGSLTFESSAQDAEAAMREAARLFQSGETDTAIAAAQQGVELAVTPSEQFNSVHLLAEIQAEAGDYTSAYDNYRAALAVLETHAPNQFQLQSDVMSSIGHTAFDLGHRAEWLEWGERAQALIRADMAVLFRFEDGDLARHRLSAFACGPGAGDIVRTDFTIFVPSGRDVACVYSIRDDDRIAMTVHISHQQVNQAQAFEGANNAVRRNRSNADQLARGSREIVGAPVEFAIYGERGMRTGVFTSQVGDWTIKLRLTDYVSVLSDAEWDAAAELTFGGIPEMAAHAAQCADALVGAGTLTGSNDPVVQLQVALGLAQTMMDEEDSASRRADAHLDCLLGEIPFSPDGGVAYGELDADGSLVAVSAHPSGTRDRMVQARPSSNGLAPGVHLTRQTDELSEFFGVYDDFPSGETFAADVSRLLNRQLPVESTVTQDVDGNMEITLSAAAGTDEP